MQRRDDGILLAPTDLVNFLGCAHATFLDIQQLSKPHSHRPPRSEGDQLLADKGNQHEAEHLKLLKDAGKNVVEIAKGDPLKIEKTLEAMRAGVDVVYQAALRDCGWGGLADFLMRVESPSGLGSFSYEASDTKFARSAKPEYLIQLGVYSDMVRHVQRTRPRHMHVVLDGGKEESFLEQDFAAYVRHARRRLEQLAENPPKDSYPEPCAHCTHCSWKEQCESQWEKDDHLSLVANMQRAQADKLRSQGITSLAVLAKAKPSQRVPELNPAIFERLRAQASLQLYKRDNHENKHELLPPEEGRGFARLPQPDPGDLFFDMEGDPFYPEGLEYLFGVCFQNGDKLEFKPFWAHDREEEKKTFSEFMAFLHDHLTAYPNAFIYHYNHYEPTALKRLANNHAVAEHQLADLLRGEKFVDLYRVVCKAIRVSEPAYSLKNLETFYREAREGDVASAGDSIVVYNQWCVSRDEGLLKAIAAYNKTDCESTAKLRDWLLTLRPKNTPWFSVAAPPEDKEADEKKSADRMAREERCVQYKERLVAAAAANEDDYRLHLADLLGFYEREDSPQWWAHYARRDSDEVELIEDNECLAGLELEGKPVPDKRSLTYTFRFPPQETKRRVGETVINVATGKYSGKIAVLDEAKSLVKIRIGAKSEMPKRLSVGPERPRGADAQREAIYRVADDVLEGRDHYPAVRDILSRAAPRIRGREPGEPIAQGDDLLKATAEAVAGLDRSFVFIQGPPGAGKTYTSAHAIVELIRDKKKVGVAANSHAAINNLLKKVEELATQNGVSFKGIKKSDEGDKEFNGTFIRNVPKNDDVSLDVDLLAGTVWLFSQQRFDQHLHTLFIDEAGQVSVANVVAMGTSAKNIVLVGDQMQLGQPIQGVHPGQAGLSILDFLLQGKATVPPDRGIFLDQSRRMRPEVCGFISDAFYEGKLKPHPITSDRRLIFSNAIDGLRPEGIHFHPVLHSGYSQKCVPEGQVVQDYYLKLLKQQFQDEHNKTRAMTIDDILVVSPYNVQVNYLKSILPDGARVGTVDKFQGQEAPVVLVSMATSDAECLPRGVEFLFSANRLNVAVSRAQCLAVVVASPELLATPCNTVEQLRLVNKFCLLAECAAGVASP